MSSDRKRLNVSKIRFNMLESLLLNDTFPPKAGYHESKWAAWGSRIEKGHKEEAKSISEWAKKYESSDNSSDWIDDDYWRLANITNAMYAALVVAIWADMEHMLKSIAETCFYVLKKKEKALRKTEKFCQDVLTSKKDISGLSACIKDLKALQAGIPYQFGEIKAFFKKELSINFENLPDYNIIDAIRILNNSFKHSNGRYVPEKGKPQTKIEKSLCNNWKIKEVEDIPYSELPIADLASSCHNFCSELMTQVQTHKNIKAAMKANV
jgi:hypothetical protein